MSGYTTLITRRRIGAGRLSALLLVLLASAGCYQQEMANQERLDPLEYTELFEDHRASRDPVAGTVARGNLRDDEFLYTGRVDGELAPGLPMELDLDLLARGHERYDIFCSPCHDRVGNGNGIVVQRGFRRPSSFHVERLRQAEPSYYFDVMTNGFGAMFSYASQVPVEDRWAIAAYMKALQLSQQVPVELLDDADLDGLGGRR